MSLYSRFRRRLSAVRTGVAGGAEWRTRPLTSDVAARLIDAGVSASAAGRLDLVEVVGGRLEGWITRGNRLCLSAGLPIPASLLPGLISDDTTDALVVLMSDLNDVAYLYARGTRPTIFIGPESRLPHGEVHCGSEATIVLEGLATGTWHPTLDARNGGLIHAEWDQLWASDVRIATDDMHRIEDVATGQRVNAYGAEIRIGRHVWLGRDSLVTGGAVIGNDVVVGARSMVRGRDFPDQCVLGGTPARVLREGTTWSREDRP